MAGNSQPVPTGAKAQGLKRRRIKKLLQNVKDQVEFFFGDRNLVRDKFLLDKVGSEGTKYIPIALLETFNTIKKLGADSKLIARAIEGSNILELDADAKQIRRKHPLRPQGNYDHCTVYVEGLPSDTTVGWLKQVCSKLGHTKHINLPRFKKSGEIKGFAFIEFSQTDEVYRACNILNSPPSRFFPNRTESYLARLTQGFPSSSDKKVNSAIQNQSNHSTKEKQGCKSTQCTSKKEDSKCNPTSSKCKEYLETDSKRSEKKNPVTTQDTCMVSKLINRVQNDVPTNRKRCVSEPLSAPSNTGEIHNPAKVRKTLPHASHPRELNARESCKRSPRSETKGALVNGNVDADATGLDIASYILQARRLAELKHSDTKSNKVSLSKCSSSPDFSKLTNTPKLLSTVVAVPRKRRRRKEKRNKGKTRQESPSLRAMPKLMWLDLKKNYLRQQRDEMGKLKSILQNTAPTHTNPRSAFIKRHLVLDESASIDDAYELTNTKLEQATSPVPHQQNNGDRMETETASADNRRADVAFKPGVITRIRTIAFEGQTQSEFLPDHKKLKQYFTRYGQVAYVDCCPNKEEGFLRFENAESAQRAILEEQKFSVFLLTGVEEERYWDKLLAARALKRSRERPKVRGRQKLANKAIKITSGESRQHIKFNEDFK